MNLCKKIEFLISYCGMYISHNKMIDEHTDIDEFNVKLKTELELKAYIKNASPIIIITGEAGDGKSRLIRSLSDTIRDSGYDRQEDFSQCTPEEKTLVMNKISQALENSSNDEKVIIAANVGILADELLNHGIDLDKVNNNEKIKFVNLQKRNLAEDKEEFTNIIKEFLKYDVKTYCECVCWESCPYKKNIDYLSKEITIKALMCLCDALALKGDHITFRELLSLISYMVTNAIDCATYKKAINKPNINIYNIFDNENDRLLSKFTDLDPAYKDSLEDHTWWSKIQTENKCETLKEAKREAFFNSTNSNLYEKISLPYIVDYRKIRQTLAQIPEYHMYGSNPELRTLENGFIKLILPDENTTKLSVYTKVLGKDNFMNSYIDIDFNKIPVFWHLPGFNVNKKDDDSIGKFYNYICLSVVDKDELKTLIVNYKMYKLIMDASYGIYSRDTKTVYDEYGISTFFQSILMTGSEDREKKINIRLNDSYSGFSMKKIEQNGVFGNEGREYVQLKLNERMEG